jgi:hypothetical protein
MRGKMRYSLSGLWNESFARCSLALSKQKKKKKKMVGRGCRDYTREENGGKSGKENMTKEKEEHTCTCRNINAHRKIMARS